MAPPYGRSSRGSPKKVDVLAGTAHVSSAIALWARRSDQGGREAGRGRVVAKTRCVQRLRSSASTPHILLGLGVAANLTFP